MASARSVERRCPSLPPLPSRRSSSGWRSRRSAASARRLRGPASSAAGPSCDALAARTRSGSGSSCETAETARAEAERRVQRPRTAGRRRTPHQGAATGAERTPPSARPRSTGPGARRRPTLDCAPGPRGGGPGARRHRAAHPRGRARHPRWPRWTRRRLWPGLSDEETVESWRGGPSWSSAGWGCSGG